MTPRQQVHAQPGTSTLLDSEHSGMVPSAVSRSVPPPGGGRRAMLQHPQASGKPLPSLFVLARRPSVSDSQMYLAMIPTMYLAPGTFPARSPITARREPQSWGRVEEEKWSEGAVSGWHQPSAGEGPIHHRHFHGTPVACPPPAALLIL